MRLLSGSEEKEAMKYIDEAARVAQNSGCDRKKCGSIIVKDGKIISEAFNGPPGNLESQRRCSNSKDTYHNKLTDKSCCIHAEERAIIIALRTHPEKIIGSRLYFTRLDESGENEPAGRPWCTLCSKMALEAGIKEFVLWHKDGITVYDTEEYNTLSFQYRE
jgi:deoxycytidylate deaminase